MTSPARVREVLAAAARASGPAPCHPADVTASRLLDHAALWRDRLTPGEQAAITAVRDALHRIAQEDGDRRPAVPSITVDTEPGS